MPGKVRSSHVGEVLAGRYRVDSILGRGGMAVVYRATHLLTERPVALKLLLEASRREEDQWARFKREAKAAARLRHPNVVDVLDMGETEDGEYYLALELLEGETLRQRLDRAGRIEEEECITLLRPVMSALAAAHAIDLIHRDVKPDNIFLSKNGSGEIVPKLLDFGLVKDLDSSLDAQTRAGMVIGTPFYMAPEQADAHPNVGPPADVWSMAVVLYHCLTGEKPFRGENSLAVLLAVTTGHYTPIEKVAPFVSPGLVRAIDGAMRVHPQERYPNMGAFLEAIDGRHAVISRVSVLEAETVDAPHPDAASSSEKHAAFLTKISEAPQEDQPPPTVAPDAGASAAAPKTQWLILAVLVVAVVGLIISQKLVDRPDSAPPIRPHQGPSLSAVQSVVPPAETATVVTSTASAAVETSTAAQATERAVAAATEAHQALERVRHALRQDAKRAQHDVAQARGKIARAKGAQRAARARAALADAEARHRALRAAVTHCEVDVLGGDEWPEVEKARTAAETALASGEHAKAAMLWDRVHALTRTLVQRCENGPQERADPAVPSQEETPPTAEIVEDEPVRAEPKATSREDRARARALFERGREAQRKGRLEEAIGLYDRAIESAPTFVAAYNARGLAYQARQAIGDAIVDFSKAIELAPKNAVLHNNRGQARLAREEIEAAIDDFTKAIELEPRNGLFHENRAIAHLKLGREEKSLADFTAALARDDKRLTSYFHRGRIHQKLHEHGRARDDFSKVLELDPKHVEARYRRAVSRTELEDLAGAVTDFDGVIASQPTHAQAHLRRGLVEMKLGKREEAREDLQRFLRLDPTSDHRVVAESALRKL